MLNRIPIFDQFVISEHLNLPLDEIRSDIDQCLNDISKVDPDWSRNYTTYFFQDYNKKLFDRPWALDLRENLKNIYREISSKLHHVSIEKLSNDDIDLFIWANKYLHYSYHNSHIHPNSIISGTVYIKMDDPDASAIIYTSPFEHIKWTQKAVGVPGSKTNYGITDERFNPSGDAEEIIMCDVRPVDGDVLFWPSYLRHHVDRQQVMNKFSYERYSISFNLAHAEVGDMYASS